MIFKKKLLRRKGLKEKRSSQGSLSDLGTRTNGNGFSAKIFV